MKDHSIMMKNPPQLDPDRETRPFFWFLTLVLVSMYVVVLFENPEIRQPLRLAIFTVLLGVHLVLHWVLRVQVKHPGWTLKYLFVQAGLAFTLALFSNHLVMNF